MRKLGMLWAAFLLLNTSLGWAQSGTDKVCEINMTSPKPGASKAFEEARKKHNEFHKAEKDKNGIAVWSTETGPATGSYMTSICGLTWKEMDGRDDFERRDREDIEKTMADSTASNQQSYWILRADLSLNPGEATAPPKMITVLHYFVKPVGLTQFTEAIKRVNAATVKAKYPTKPSRWYMLVNGGEGPQFVLVTDRNSWADMQAPQQMMVDMLKQVYGNDDKTMQTLRDAVDHTVSEMIKFRADLSYTPTK